MAADTLAVNGSVASHTKKLFRCGPMIVGFSGNLMDGLAFVRWCEAGMDMSSLPEFRMYRGSDDAPDFRALVLSAEGLTEWSEHFQPIPWGEGPMAIGSGQMAALAAMCMGATAQKAVSVACNVDHNSGGDIQVEALLREAA